MPKSITIHNIDDATATWLEEEARRQGVNVETVARQLLHSALEREHSRMQLTIYHDLNALAGTWSTEEATAFLHTIADFEHVDPSLWQ